eukprot:g11767.t1
MKESERRKEKTVRKDWFKSSVARSARSKMRLNKGSIRDIFIGGPHDISMQDARRIALAADLHAKRLDLQMMDMDRVTRYLESLTTQAALLAGFAFTVVSAPPEDKNKAWTAIFFLSACVTLGSHIYVVCVGQLSAILGPLLALKGPQGSLERALLNMKNERNRLFWLFILGLAGFYLMIVSLLWIWASDLWLQITSTILISFFFAFMGSRVYYLLEEYRFVEPNLPKLVQTGADMTRDLGLEERSDAPVIVRTNEYSGGLVSAATYLSDSKTSAPTSVSVIPAPSSNVQMGFVSAATYLGLPVTMPAAGATAQPSGRG